jgi:hypothetical protein
VTLGLDEDNLHPEVNNEGAVVEDFRGAVGSAHAAKCAHSVSIRSRQLIGKIWTLYVALSMMMAVFVPDEKPARVPNINGDWL